MLEAGEIVLATLGVGVLFLLCACGICLMFFYSDKEKGRGTQLREPRLEEAPPPSDVRPTRTVERAVGPTIISRGGRRQRRDSTTQTDTEDNEIVVEEEIRSEPTQIPRPSSLARRLNIAAAPAEAVQTQHNASEFPSDLRQLQQSSHSVLDDEFEILRRRAVARWKSREVAAMNPRKNRYEDAVPYDENRVQLSGGEYINASYIDSYLSSKHFIATQWPISQYELAGREDTVDDFWKMVWEKRVSSIVALSGSLESMPSYWPPQRSFRRYGEIKVEQKMSYEEAKIIVRKFLLEKRGERRELTQFHISDWDDGDAADGEEVLRLAHRVKTSVTPIIVHCSAGIGRSGVFIAVCRLLEQADRHRIVDVFKVVDAMRQQRPGMVQNRTQYENIYEILRMAIEEKTIKSRF